MCSLTTVSQCSINVGWIFNNLSSATKLENQELCVFNTVLIFSVYSAVLNRWTPFEPLQINHVTNLSSKNPKHLQIQASQMMTANWIFSICDFGLWKKKKYFLSIFLTFYRKKTNSWLLEGFICRLIMKIIVPCEPEVKCVRNEKRVVKPSHLPLLRSLQALNTIHIILTHTASKS